MARILLSYEGPGSNTSVPNIFIDNYMPEANGEFVKVYLYLLRCIGSGVSDLSVSMIADKFEHTEKDIIRSLKYWERQGLLALDYNPDKSLCGIRLLDISPSAPEVPAEEPDVTTIPDKKEYSLDEVKALRQDPELSELFFIIEAYIRKPLSNSDTNIVLYWYDALHFSTDLIAYLVEYCISKGHSSMRYMDKVAINWVENNITTVELAKENAAIHSKAYYAVIKALGISGRNLADSENAFVNRWTKDLGFSVPIIEEACKRTISATHQPSFEYTDSILNSWYKNKVRTLDDIKALDNSFNKTRKVTVQTNDNVIPSKKGNKFSNFNQRDYDYDQLEQMLLTTPVQ